MYCWN